MWDDRALLPVDNLLLFSMVLSSWSCMLLLLLLTVAKAPLLLLAGWCMLAVAGEDDCWWLKGLFRVIGLCSFKWRR